MMLQQQQQQQQAPPSSMSSPPPINTSTALTTTTTTTATTPTPTPTPTPTTNALNTTPTTSNKPPPPTTTTTPLSSTTPSSSSLQLSSLQLSSTKKEKLSAILGDGSFESIMKQRASKRREKDEQCIAELRYSISNMDSNLTQEIKRRIEAVKTLEKDCLSNITIMEQKLEQCMNDKVQTIEFRLQTMEDKIHELNERLEEERNKIPKDIETKGRELKNMVQTFQQEFAQERRERLSREGQIMKQLTDHADEMRNTWQSESQNREECVKELRSRLDQQESSRAQADAGFESLIARELEALRMEVERERNERMTEDDEIVDALNRYTENLQMSLSTLSMTGV